MIKSKKFIVTTAALFLTSAAYATPIEVNPTTDGSTVEIEIHDSNCASWAPCTADTEVSSQLDSVSAWLGIGDSITFDFFDITVGGLGYVSDATITATLAFISPAITPVSNGQGSFFTFFGLVSGGELIWDQPGLIDLEDGSFLEIVFEDLSVIGFGDTTTVSATVGRGGELITEPVAVPEPATLALFGLGLLAFGLSRRKIRI